MRSNPPFGYLSIDLRLWRNGKNQLTSTLLKCRINIFNCYGLLNIGGIALNIVLRRLLAVVIALVMGLASHFNLLYWLDNTAGDMIYQQQVPLDGSVYILGIDARALEEFGRFDKWDRDIMAAAVEALNANPDARPAAIGLDIMFFGQTQPQYDDALTAACAQYDNVVVGTNITFDENSVILNEDGSYTVKELAVVGFEEPYDALKAVTRQGHVNTMPDADGVMRSNVHSAQLPDGRVSYSFGYELYKLYAQRNGLPAEVTPPVNDKGQWYVPFSGKPGAFYDDFSVLDIINGDIPSEIFQDSVVLIGPYAVGMMDAYRTAMDHTLPMYGVEIHANIVSAFMNGNFKEYAPNWLQTLLVVAAALVLYFVFGRLHPKFSTPLAVAVILGYLGLCLLLCRSGWLLKVIYLPLTVVLLYLGWLAVNYATALMEKKKMTDTFKKYVAPQVVDEIIKRGRDALKLGGDKRDIACMFVDIRGFTTMSEQLSPEEVVGMLNAYLALTSSAVFRHGGTLDKFIGDATMALFNAPLDMEDYAYKAVLTAWDIVKGGEELGKSMMERYGKSVSFGVGVNLGPAVVGNIGTDVRMDYTAIGDTINTAARLESNAKGGQVLISQAVYDAVCDRVEAVDLGEIPLKGKAVGVKVYSLTQIYEEKKSDERLASSGVQSEK